jgi:hypothetical protein
MLVLIFHFSVRMLFLAGVEGRYIHYFWFPHAQNTLTWYSSVSLLLLLCKELGVQHIVSFLSGGGLSRSGGRAYCVWWSGVVWLFICLEFQFDSVICTYNGQREGLDHTWCCAALWLAPSLQYENSTGQIPFTALYVNLHKVWLYCSRFSKQSTYLTKLLSYLCHCWVCTDVHIL